MAANSLTKPLALNKHKDFIRLLGFGDSLHITWRLRRTDQSSLDQ
ncbi:hypothetical protein CGRA01v4_12178 [Colletotrichum graminicola]|nr:hypothetical protein CGRA01v4_12178 [Colletotrichum graminicola]